MPAGLFTTWHCAIICVFIILLPLHLVRSPMHIKQLVGNINNQAALGTSLNMAMCAAWYTNSSRLAHRQCSANAGKWSCSSMIGITFVAYAGSNSRVKRKCISIIWRTRVGIPRHAHGIGASFGHTLFNSSCVLSFPQLCWCVNLSPLQHNSIATNTQKHIA